jgi:hypothetical protein
MKKGIIVLQFAMFVTSLLFSVNVVLAGQKTKMPETVSIYIRGAQIGPGKKDGTAWDGTGKLSEAQTKVIGGIVAKSLAIAAGANPVGASILAASMLSGPLLTAGAKPDVFGWFQFAQDGAYSKEVYWLNRANSPRREFSVLWIKQDIGVQNVRWNEKLRIRVVLKDADLINNDDIGSVVLNANHFREVYRLKKSVPIFVADQSDGQLLTVTIEVTD